MFKPGLSESTTLRAKGMVEIPLPDDDPSALLILLNIIHGYIRKVPQKVNFLMLTQLSVLIDKYELHEVAELISSQWVSELSKDMPCSFTDETLPWIFVSWVFQKRELFLEATKIAMRESRCMLRDAPGHELPIPSSISGSIDEKRQNAVSGLITELMQILERYSEPGYCCVLWKRDGQNERKALLCDSLILGSLTKGLNSIGLIPAPESPFDWIEFDSLAYDVRNLPIPTWSGIKGRIAWKYRGDYIPDCDVKGVIESKSSELESDLCGLELDEFLSRRRDEGS
ncbi:MAG: hypothetical protein M1837_005244 [Sclerophora amabilis]|nr:MAG: hypothetical protein M1837_005244 [Sclerophora amabilis]